MTEKRLDPEEYYHFVMYVQSLPAEQKEEIRRRINERLPYECQLACRALEGEK